MEPELNNVGKVNLRSTSRWKDKDLRQKSRCKSKDYLRIKEFFLKVISKFFKRSF